MSEITEKALICKKCGQSFNPRFYLSSRDYCSDCSHKIADEQKKRDEEFEKQAIIQTKEKWRQECGIPLRFRTSRFDSFDHKVHRSIMQAWRACQEYASTFDCRNPQLSKSLLMYSPSVWGVGKTYLACSIVNAILDRWNSEVAACPVMFISEPQLFMRIRATYNRRNNNEEDRFKETEEEIYRKLTNVLLLILDDVGKEEVSDSRFVQRVLFAVIDGRYQKMLPIVLTANLNPGQLDMHLGGDKGNSASMDRLVEMTGNVFYELNGTSYRDVSKRAK